MLRRLYDWVIGFAGHRHALSALALVSFAESSVFPVPPDVLLLPMVLARPKRAWIVALVCTLASVAGGVAGYAIGALLFDAVGRPLLSFYGYMAEFERFQATRNRFQAATAARRSSGAPAQARTFRSAAVSAMSSKSRT